MTRNRSVGLACFALLVLWGCREDPYSNPTGTPPAPDPYAQAASRREAPRLRPAKRRAKAKSTVDKLVDPDSLLKAKIPAVRPTKPGMFGKKSKIGGLLGKKSDLSFGDKSLSLGGKGGGGGLSLGGGGGLSLGGGGGRLSLEGALGSQLSLDLDSLGDDDKPASRPATSRPTSQAAAGSQPTTMAAASQPTKKPAAREDPAPAAPAEVLFPKDGILAKVDESPITLGTFRREMQLRTRLFMMQNQRGPGADESKALMKKTLDSLVSRMLLYQRAIQRGLTVKADEKKKAYKRLMDSLPAGARLEQLLRQTKMTRKEFEQRLERQVILQKYMRILASEIEVPRSALEREYKKTLGKGKVRARHILILAGEDASPKKIQAAREKAKKVQKLAADGGDFVQLAKQYSEDPSSSEGGDLGFLQRGDALEVLENAIFSLKNGGVSSVIRSPAGFHVVKVVERKAPPPFLKVAGKLMMQVRMEKLKGRLKELTKRLRAESDVEILVPWGK